MPNQPCEISIVISCFNMRREMPRTLQTLARSYQREVGDLDYEIIIADNGSAEPLPAEMWAGLGCPVRYMRFPAGDHSPVKAINAAMRQANGRLLALMIDGARMLSPGVLKYSRLAAKAYPRPVVCTHGFHLGPDVQSRSMAAGYNQQREDALLEGIDWRTDGYRLFDISVFGGSSFRGWFISPTESNCLVMPRELWQKLDFLDERFITPGGGLVNLDIFKRACETPGTQLVTLLGEGSFHQFHGGAATGKSATAAAPAQNPNEAFDREYAQIRGEIYRIPTYAGAFLGELHPRAVKHVQISAQTLSALSSNQAR